MSAIPIVKPKATVHENEKKWSKELMKVGWTAIPSVILERQQALKLDPVDVNILLQIARHWWYADDLPFPSKGTIAECIGVDPRTVQRHITKMEKAKILKRQTRFKKTRGQMSNAYDFGPLIEQAKPFAEEANETKKQQIAERRDRRMRMRAKPNTKMRLVGQ